MTPRFDLGARDAAGKYLLVRCGAELYGVPLRDVEEILDAREVIPLEGAPSPAMGQLVRSERAMWALDLSARFGAARVERRGERCALVVRTLQANGPSMLGLVVDGAEFVIEPDASAVRPLPLLGRPLLPCVTEVAEHESRLVLLLHVDSLLSGEEAERLSRPPEATRSAPVRAST